jgi:hypothetical protein
MHLHKTRIWQRTVLRSENIYMRDLFCKTFYGRDTTSSSYVAPIRLLYTYNLLLEVINMW